MGETRRCCSEAFTVEGVWWEPANPTHQVSGSFAWDPSSGGELNLMFPFRDESGSSGIWRGGVLHGMAEQSTFTLIDCRGEDITFQIPGVLRRRLRPSGGVLVGGVIPDVTQPSFDHVTLEIDHLAELSGRSLPAPEFEWPNGGQWSDGGHPDRIVIQYEHPRDVVAMLPHEMVRLASEPDLGGWASDGRLEISETVVLSVDTWQPLSLEEIVTRYVPRLRDLITFAAQRPTAIRSVRVAGPVTTVDGGEGKPIKLSLQYLAPFLPAPQERAKRRAPLEQLVALPADDRAFRALVRGWFELADRLGPVLDLRFAPSYATFIYSESRFLNAVQAVEALHRRVLQGKPDQTDLDARAAAIASCPPEHETWLKDKLEYSHEPTLRRRLREVLDYVGPALSPLTGRRSSFIARVVAMRNVLTHWDKKSTRPAGAELFQLAVDLNFIVDAALLRLLGFDEEQLTATLTRNSRFSSRHSDRATGGGV